MGEGDVAGLALVLGAIGGALGARISGADAWRGVTIAVGASLAAAFVMYLLGSSHPALMFASAVIIASAIGGVMKMRARQIASVLTGYLLVVVVGGSAISAMA